MTLAEVFQAERPDAALSPAELEPVLAEQVHAGRNAWPDLAVATEELVRRLARHLPTGGSVADLSMLRGADLHLACACARGDAAAMAALEARYFGEIDAAIARLGGGPADASDVKQLLRRVLFVAEGARPPAIASYAGRGDLRGWIRVSAVREAQRLLARERRELHFDDETMLDALSPAHDPELSWLRDHYREELAASMRVALAATTPRERSVLRYQLLDGLSIDEIGALHGVHRSTAARWLERARVAILEATRAELARRLGASGEEVDSIIRLVHSRLEVSVERILGRDDPEP